MCHCPLIRGRGGSGSARGLTPLALREVSRCKGKMERDEAKKKREPEKKETRREQRRENREREEIRREHRKEKAHL